MTTNTVDIEVRLDGAEEAKKGLKGIGETAASMADRFEQSNSHLGEGLGAVVGNVEEAQGAFKDLTSTITSLGTGGKASFLSLVPAIGGVVAVGFALYETFMNITGATQRAEEAHEAYAAAAGDLQSKLEALAEKGVIPAREEMAKFTRQTLLAQMSKERVQIATEKVAKAIEKEDEAQKHLTQTIIQRESVTSRLLSTLGLMDTVSEARIKLNKRVEESNKAVNKVLNAQLKTQKRLADAERQFIAFEERSPIEIANKTRENAARLKSLELLEIEQIAKKDAREHAKLDLEQEHADIASRLKAAEEAGKQGQKTQLVALAKEIENRLNFRDEEALIQEDIERKRREIEKSRIEENAKTNAELIAKRKARAAIESAIERQTQNEIFTIRAMSLQHARMMGANQLDILDAQHQLELERAGDNNNRRLMADIKYQMSRTQLEKVEADKRAAEEKRQAEQRRAFILDSRAFDIDMMHDGIDKELAALELRYDRERDMKQRSEAEITELTRRANLQRAAIQQKFATEQINEIAQMTRSIAGGFAEAGYAALVTGESFEDSSAKIIGALGKQATIEAVLETAKGFAALVLNPAAAAGHFLAATKFGIAAAAAGTMSASLGGGGGAPRASTGAASPSGSPQVAPITEREQADNRSMVFNVNFGGAVVYDTKRAAEIALVDRITTLQNMNRRGAPRRRF